MFKDAAAGPEPDWGRYEHLSQDAWRAELDALRRANDMVNDDCTLVVLRVAGVGEEPDEAIPDALPIEDRSQETEDRSQETGDRSEETGDRSEETGNREEGTKSDETAAESSPTDSCPLPPELTPDSRPLTPEEPAARDGFPESTDPRD